MENRTYGDLAVTVLDDNAALGQHAAATFAELVRAELSERDEIAVILATGNSLSSSPPSPNAMTSNGRASPSCTWTSTSV